MSPHQTLAVMVRLVSIWLLLYSISNMTGAYVQAHKYNAADSLLPIFSYFGAVAILCAVLWFFPLIVARGLLPPSATVAEHSPIFESWFSVGCSLIGVWVLAKAIPALTRVILGHYLGQKFWPDSYEVSSELPLLVAVNCFEVVMGLWLFLGGKGLKKILHWARYS